MSLTYDVLLEANKSIKTTPIKGKEYAEVPQRVNAFRLAVPAGSIESEIVSLENGVVIMKATVRDEDGKILGIGHAYEKEDSTFINKTSYIENCETSAVGRALGMCGFGIDTSMASYEEVTNAINNQNKESENPVLDEAKLRAKILAYVNRHKMSVENQQKICALYKVTSLNALNLEQCKHYIAKLEENGGSIDE